MAIDQTGHPVAFSFQSLFPEAQSKDPGKKESMAGENTFRQDRVTLSTQARNAEDRDAGSIQDMAAEMDQQEITRLEQLEENNSELNETSSRALDLNKSTTSDDIIFGARKYPDLSSAGSKKI